MTSPTVSEMRAERCDFFKLENGLTRRRRMLATAAQAFVLLDSGVEMLALEKERKRRDRSRGDSVGGVRLIGVGLGRV